MKPPGASQNTFVCLTHKLLCPAWAARSCTAPLHPRMFLTVNLITGTEARVTNHQRVESFGCELQWLHGTLLWWCQTQALGGNQHFPTEQHQGSAVPSHSRAHKAATLPLQPKSSGKFLTSNAPANIPKCTAQLSALKPLTWNCISSLSPALHANRVCKDRICCCFKNWHSTGCAAWLWIAGSTLQVVFSAVSLLALKKSVVKYHQL